MGGAWWLFCFIFIKFFFCHKEDRLHGVRLGCVSDIHVTFDFDWNDFFRQFFSFFFYRILFSVTTIVCCFILKDVGRAKSNESEPLWSGSWKIEMEKAERCHGNVTASSILPPPWPVRSSHPSSGTTFNPSNRPFLLLFFIVFRIILSFSLVLCGAAGVAVLSGRQFSWFFFFFTEFPFSVSSFCVCVCVCVNVLRCCCCCFFFFFLFYSF